jgi:hypothetical protein
MSAYAIEGALKARLRASMEVIIFLDILVLSVALSVQGSENAGCSQATLYYGFVE